MERVSFSLNKNASDREIKDAIKEALSKTIIEIGDSAQIDVSIGGKNHMMSWLVTRVSDGFTITEIKHA